MALDADSGFLLVEKYADRRDQETWNAALTEGLTGLPAVTVQQVVGDCAKGLVAHALHGLGVPHSPDLFHAQHELTTALAPALAAKTRQARGWLEETQEKLTKTQQAAATAANQPRGSGRPIDHQSQVKQLEQLVAGMTSYVAVCEGRQEALREAVRGMGQDDHPIDLASGARAGQGGGALPVGTASGGGGATGCRCRFVGSGVGGIAESASSGAGFGGGGGVFLDPCGSGSPGSVWCRNVAVGPEVASGGVCASGGRAKQRSGAAAGIAGVGPAVPDGGAGLGGVGTCGRVGGSGSVGVGKWRAGLRVRVRRWRGGTVSWPCGIIACTG